MVGGSCNGRLEGVGVEKWNTAKGDIRVSVREG